ncbi:MAG: oligopeptide ABC transporter permease OppB [Stagnimonas sp.]|nr:oligopeptide ABC transporter permease OppB [Stagnimonas sp.]
MMRHAAKRLLMAVPTLLVLVTLTFFLMRLAPGGPFDRERSLPPEIEKALAAEYHLDESLPKQYLRYLGNLLQGDLGPSFQYEGFRVSELIATGLPVSLALGALAMGLALLIGGAMGILAALNHRRLPDYGVMSAALLGVSIPSYVVAPLLVLVFAIGLRWLPAGGWVTGRWSDLVLPVMALALPQISAIARLLRGSLLEVLQQPYLRTARAKGLSPAKVILRHALKPALMPLVSYLGPATAGILTGSVVVEQVFNLPGIGRYFVQGALNRDYTLVLGVVAVYGTMIVLFNFLVDLAYGALDPRIKTA